MKYQLAPLYVRPWTLNGMSTKLIESHYENNYGGALRRLNSLSVQLQGIDYSKTPPHVLNALKREELVALNSTLLHELYFASLGGDGKPTAMLSEALESSFGSVDRWRSEFVTMAQGLGGGSGWVVLTWIPRDGRLINQYAQDHTQSIAGGVPIMTIDMFEHAYHIDFGANAKAYIDAFMRNVDWKATHARYEDAIAARPPRPLVQEEFGDLPGVSVEEVKAMLDAGKPVQIIDTRPKHYVSKTQDIMEGAKWYDPDRIDEWVGQLSKDEPVVTFCVYGFHVGCRSAIALRAAGFDARYMKGGHAAWKAIGGKVNMFP